MALFDIVIVVLLILINGVLSMSELAVVSSRRSRLQSMAKRGNRGARAALKLAEDPTRFLSTVQIGITLVGVLAGAFSGVTLGRRLGVWLEHTFPALASHGDTIAVAVVVISITYVTLIIGELVPKRIALRRPERIAATVAPFMHQLSKVASPLVWVLKASTEAIVHAIGLKGHRETTVTEDEVRMLIAEGTRAGIFLERERDMIDGVLRLADRRVRAIMTPRHDVVWLDITDSPDAIAAKLKDSHTSRLPVCQGTIDHPIGIVQTKDLAPILLKGESVDIGKVMVQPLVVPEGVLVLKLLEMFRSEGVHMALIVDEYGTTEGIVTLSDILEAITGELPEQGEEVDASLVRRSDGSWLVDGSFPIDEFEDRLRVVGLRDVGDFDTMAGLALHQMERLPEVGDSFPGYGGRFEVVDMDGHRIDKLLFIPPSKKAS